jgi:hypothetical protein
MRLSRSCIRAFIARFGASRQPGRNLRQRQPAKSLLSPAGRGGHRPTLWRARRRSISAWTTAVLNGLTASASWKTAFTCLCLRTAT